MKNFQIFIKEDFNSPKATQFSLPVTSSSKFSPNGQSKDIIVFYEHLKTSTINLPKYSKSFLSPSVSSFMNTNTSDWRVLVYYKTDGFHVFVWRADILHSYFINSLESYKNTDKYPSDIKYNKLYNETLMLRDNDKIGKIWCFPYIIWQSKIVVNLIEDSLVILDKYANIKDKFQLSESQWINLLTNQYCSI